jgi:hypothetical protein
MKKLLLILVLVPLLLASCKKDPEDQPVEIRSYVMIYSLLKEPFTLTWSADGVEVPDAQDYGSRILGAVLLEEMTEEISFTVKNSGSGELIESLLLTMEMNKYYLIILYGTADEPILEVQEHDYSRPESGYVRFQFLHAAASLDSVDVYMGGTEASDRKVTDLSFAEFSDNFQVLDYVVRNSVVVAVHGDTYDPEKEVLNYEYNDLIVSNTNYLSVIGYATGDPLDTELKLWLYDLPTQ